MDVVISKSKHTNTKYKSVIDGKKTVHFGASGYQDFTSHKDKDRKQRYSDRHKKREDFGTAGFWAKNVLWNKETLTKSVDDLNNRFTNINIKIK